LSPTGEKFVNFFISGINTIIRGLNAIPFVNIGLIADVSLPKIPILDTGAYVAPTPGGTIARLAASGVGEYVMTPNQLAAQTGGSGGGSTTINIYPTGMMMGTAPQLAAAIREELLKIGSRNVNVGLT
jgi:ABC-type transport system substrate-binding protein